MLLTDRAKLLSNANPTTLKDDDWLFLHKMSLKMFKEDKDAALWYLKKYETSFSQLKPFFQHIVRFASSCVNSNVACPKYPKVMGVLAALAGRDIDEPRPPASSASSSTTLSAETRLMNERAQEVVGAIFGAVGFPVPNIIFK